MSGEVRIARSVDETERFGEALAPALATGDVLALTGDLGAGKTRFVAGLARGLRCKARVRSPSFAIVNEYHGDRLLLHLDLYRLDTVDAESLGLEVYLRTDMLTLTTPLEEYLVDEFGSLDTFGMVRFVADQVV